MKLHIKAMAEDRAAIKAELSRISDQLNMHFIKVLMYPDADCLNHWKGEIYAFLHRVDRLKGKNKWPKAEFIRESISTHNDMIQEYMYLVEDEEFDLSPRWIAPIDVKNAIEEYDDWISHELSSHGIVRRSDVYSKIDELLRSTL